MKPNENTSSMQPVCKTAACMECDLCKTVNFEEKRDTKPDPGSEMKSLYGAEALSYYFYFMATSNRA